MMMPLLAACSLGSCAFYASLAADKEQFSLPAGMDMSSALQSVQEILEGKHHFSVTEKMFAYDRSQGSIPDVARPKFKLALQQKYEHKSDASLKSFDEAIKLAPKYIPIYFEKAGLLADLKKTDQAIIVCNQLLAIDPKNFAGLHLRACCYDELHKYQQAVDDYTKAIAINPSDASAYEQRSKVYAKMGRRADADHDKLEADRRSVRRKVGLAMMKGDADSALKTLDDAIKNDPTNLELRTSKIMLCMRSDKQADAIATCTSMMKNFPELQGPLFCMRANAYSDLDKNEQAISDYTQAIPLLEHPPVVSGNNKKLIEAMIANASGTVLVERASLYLRTKQNDKAIADYTKFLTTHKNAAKVYLMRAEAYKLSGDMKKAAADCKTARNLAPTNDKIKGAADEILAPENHDIRVEKGVQK